MFEYIKQRYEKAKQLAEELWLHKDTTGNPNDYYYFECGFVNGLTYVEHELVQLKIAVRSLLDDVNKRYPDKNPREWTCKHMQLLDDLIQKDVWQRAKENETMKDNAEQSIPSRGSVAKCRACGADCVEGYDAEGVLVRVPVRSRWIPAASIIWRDAFDEGLVEEKK